MVAADKPETPLRRAPLGLCVDCLAEDQLRAAVVVVDGTSFCGVHGVAARHAGNAGDR